MKKMAVIFVCFWLLMLNTTTKTNQLSYEITYASNRSDLWEIKNEVLQTFQSIVNHVDEEYYYELINSSLMSFENKIKDSTVSMKGSIISIVIGDGKGVKIRGTFNPSCKVDIKKKSVVIDLLDKITGK